MEINEIVQELEVFLKNSKKKTVELPVLQNLFTGRVDYPAFAGAVQQLENGGVLVPVKAKGRNNKSQSLAYKYNIVQARLNRDFYQELQRLAVQLHPLIQLDRYYQAGQARWEKDRPWIEKLDRYLQSHRLPPAPALAPQRSYEITGDEKWYDEAGGQGILEMAGLSDSQLAIVNRPEPFMWAANPKLINNQHRPHWHLIVENKMPFHTLLPLVNGQEKFTTLIYGQGKGIIASFQLFYQLTGCRPDGAHSFLYYGDIDQEGISIWYALQQKYPVKPALPFYEALLQQHYTRGKANQSANPQALAAFMGYFSPASQRLLQEMLATGGYLPQEALAGEELAAVWRDYQ